MVDILDPKKTKGKKQLKLKLFEEIMADSYQ